MRNLHKYYYKDYFSPNVNGVDQDGCSLTFEDIILKEEKNRLSDSEYDKRKKKELEDKITRIQKSNVAILKARNQNLIETDYRKNKSTRELLDDAKIPNVVSPNDETNRFSLTIQYPGLVTGIGINHEAKIEGEFKLGVHFDWTYGMPVVYGSSVKGVLRAWFKEFYKPNETQPSVDDAFDSIFEGTNNCFHCISQWPQVRIDFLFKVTR